MSWRKYLPAPSGLYFSDIYTLRYACWVQRTEKGCSHPSPSNAPTCLPNSGILHPVLQSILFLYWHTGCFRSGQAAITKSHWLGGLSNIRLFSYSSEGWKSKIKVPPGLVFCKASLPGLQMTTFLLCPLCDLVFVDTEGKRKRERFQVYLLLLRRILVLLD